MPLNNINNNISVVFSEKNCLKETPKSLYN